MSTEISTEISTALMRGVGGEAYYGCMFGGQRKDAIVVPDSVGDFEDIIDLWIRRGMRHAEEDRV